MKKIYLSPPHMSGKELEYVKDVFKDNWIAPVGPHLNMFEDIVKKYKRISVEVLQHFAINLNLVLSSIITSPPCFN